jgi:tRNA-dihydrouridine synthase A
MHTTTYSPWRFCIAPMMDWTDRHCRTFHRLLTRRARLYTEMVTTPALMHGNVPRHLDFNPEEHPVALQLGGSETDELAHCARLAEGWGYDEVNLNCGCPSERVQRGAFGACLMAEPALVRDCVKAMVDALKRPNPLPVTVKHRIGIDKTDTYEFVRDFVGTVSEGGARVFIVHARSAWLKGLSPKENREIPPLRYDFAARLKQDFPDFTIVLNGGIATHAGVAARLDGAEPGAAGEAPIDGVMIGRHAYHEPWWLNETDARWFGAAPNSMTRLEVAAQMADYAAREIAKGAHLRSITRHMLGLFQGMPGARSWRRMLSDSTRLAKNDPQLILDAAALTAPVKLAA